LAKSTPAHRQKPVAQTLSPLDAAKIERAQKALKTATETIDQALDLAITKQEKNRLVGEARERFLASSIEMTGLEIRDVYGPLGDGVQPALLATSAGSLGICVLTTPARDVARWAELRPFEREVAAA